jgi:hypothetical protein
MFFVQLWKDRPHRPAVSDESDLARASPRCNYFFTSSSGFSENSTTHPLDLFEFPLLLSSYFGIRFAGEVHHSQRYELLL